MTLGSSENFDDEPWELFDRHMLGEAVVVDPVGAHLREVDDVLVV